MTVSLKSIVQNINEKTRPLGKICGRLRIGEKTYTVTLFRLDRTSGKILPSRGDAQAWEIQASKISDIVMRMLQENFPNPEAVPDKMFFGRFSSESQEKATDYQQLIGEDEKALEEKNKGYLDQIHDQIYSDRIITASGSIGPSSHTTVNSSGLESSEKVLPPGIRNTTGTQCYLNSAMQLLMESTYFHSALNEIESMGVNQINDEREKNIVNALLSFRQKYNSENPTHEELGGLVENIRKSVHDYQPGLCIISAHDDSLSVVRVIYEVLNKNSTCFPSSHKRNIYQKILEDGSEETIEYQSKSYILGELCDESHTPIFLLNGPGSDIQEQLQHSLGDISLNPVVDEVIERYQSKLYGHCISFDQVPEELLFSIQGSRSSDGRLINIPEEISFEELYGENVRKALDQESSRACFELVAVISHRGTEKAGHYISMKKQGSRWFLYNDSQVFLIDAIHNQLISSSAMPYVLLYRKKP